MTTPNPITSPLERAARAAYTRPDGQSTIPWERRTPRRRAYWRSVARRALDAGLDNAGLTRGPLAALHDGACGCTDQETDFACYALRERTAAAIRAHVLAPAVYVIPDDDPGRLYGQGYGGGLDDEGTAAEAVRALREGRATHHDEHDEHDQDEYPDLPTDPKETGR